MGAMSSITGDVYAETLIVREEPRVPDTDTEWLYALLHDQISMQHNHVFGNISCEDTPRADGLPWMPLKAIYVEPDVSWSMPDEGAGPAKSSILDALQGQCTRVLIIDQGFGAGKSLTARTLSWESSKDYLAKEAPAPLFPVFLPCPHFPSVDNLTSLLKRSLSETWADQLDLSGANLFNALKKAKGLKVLWIIDGLDEVGASDATVRLLFEQAMLWSTDHRLHRFAFFCRTHTASAIVEHKSAKKWIKKSTLRRFSLRYFNRDQRVDWLSKWSLLTGQQLEEGDRDTLLDEETYDVPLLLLMGVLAANEKQNGVNVPLRGSKTLLYEFFCTWVATGRWKAHQEELTPLEQRAGEIPRDILFDGLELVGGWGPEDPEAREAVASLLFLLSRLAWESIVQEQKARRAGELGDFDVLSKDVLERVLRELGLGPNAIPALDSVLLSAQGSANSNTNTFLFGHKSFREYLAVRFHLSVFAHMALANQGDGLSSADERAQPYTEIIGSGDLLDYSEATREFLLGASNLPTTDALRPQLPAWCVREYENSTMISPTSGQATHTNERRTIWRLTTAALRSVFSDSDNRHKISQHAFHEVTTLHQLRITLKERENATSLVLRFVTLPKALIKAVLNRADLSHADLSNAKLFMADLGGANLNHADLNRAKLSHADLNRADLSHANLSDADLGRAVLFGAKLLGAKLSHADLSGANLNGAKLLLADLRGADLSHADLSGAGLDRAKLSHADLSGADLSHADLNCADLDHADLSNARLFMADLSGADLSHADLSRADLTDVTYDQYTVWPSGFEPPTL